MEKSLISKTKIDQRIQGKTNSALVELVIALKKENTEVAKILAYPRRKRVHVNVEALDKECKEGDKVVVPGKVLGTGFLKKKIKVVALCFSEDAEKKIKDAKGEAITIYEEVKKNPKLNDLRIVR